MAQEEILIGIIMFLTGVIGYFVRQKYISIEEKDDNLELSFKRSNWKH